VYHVYGLIAMLPEAAGPPSGIPHSYGFVLG
jgi:hypothetical protein